MNRAKVFVTRSDFPSAGIELLKEKYDVHFYPEAARCPHEYMVEHIKGVDALFCVSFDQINKRVIEAAGNRLKVIGTMSLGFDHIDIEECKKRNIMVCNATNAVSVSVVAEFTVGLLLAVSRKIVSGAGAITRGEWKEWTPSFFCGRGLTNATVGIVGMGRIGQAVMDRILPFGVTTVYYFDVYHPVKSAETKGAKFATFDALLQNSDIVLATCNLTAENRGLFDARAFSLMKPSAVFINTSRGGVVDQDALLDALKNNVIRAAAIDVMYPEPLPRDHELASLPNIIITPHIASAEEIAHDKLSSVCAENIIAVLEGRDPLTPAY